MGSSGEERTGRPPLDLALLLVGVAEPPGSLPTLVRSYRTVSPLPVPGGPGHRRSVLCCPIREIAPTWLSPAPVPCGAPTFLDTVTASGSDAAATRPTHRRVQSGPSLVGSRNGGGLRPENESSLHPVGGGSTRSSGGPRSALAFVLGVGLDAGIGGDDGDVGLVRDEVLQRVQGGLRRGGLAAVA